MPKLIIVSVLILVIQFQIFAQQELPDTVGVGGLNWFAYPIIFYSPETNLAFGAGGVISFTLSEKLKSKPSSMTASGYYSINNQYDITIQPEVYVAEDKLKIWSKFNYGNIFDYFFGVGNRSKEIENQK